MISSLSFAAALLTAAPAATADITAGTSKPVLVELFSSQSCGNCPDANENLIELSEDPNVFPLVWSVSYWEYIGVKEPYATPEVQSRQRKYADFFDLRGPYTPQMVIDGCMQNSGISNDQVRVKIASVEYEKKPKVSMSLSPNTLVVGGDETAKPSDIWLVGYKPGVTELTPGKGRNAGRSIRHVHLATDLKKLGMWDGIEPAKFDLKCESEACIVIVQESETGEVLEFGIVPAVAS